MAPNPMGMSSREIATIRIAGNIHDIGKISVPAEILMKPSALTEQEFNLIKLHPGSGAAIVVGVDFEGPVHETIMQHHERLDGSGYPNGLEGDEILPEAKILSVADAFEAMTSHRPYRPAHSIGEALDILKEEQSEDSRPKYDPDAIRALKELIDLGRITKGDRDGAEVV